MEYSIECAVQNTSCLATQCRSLVCHYHQLIPTLNYFLVKGHKNPICVFQMVISYEFCNLFMCLLPSTFHQHQIESIESDKISSVFISWQLSPMSILQPSLSIIDVCLGWMYVNVMPIQVWTKATYYFISYRIDLPQYDNIC